MNKLTRLLRIGFTFPKVFSLMLFSMFTFYSFGQQSLFNSSNNFPGIGIHTNGAFDLILSEAMDADGIFYDENNDLIYQLNRTDDVINVYSGIQFAIATNTNAPLVATSTSNFANGREIAVSGNKLIVADDADADNNNVNSLVVYTLGINNTITYDKTYEVDFNLWGIHLDGNTLYAIQDNSSNLAVFNDFFNTPNGIAVPDQVIAVENLVRTHGLTYDSDSDLMILTDIGAASSADDGFLVLVSNFSTKINDNLISISEQIRVGGASSMLGNPVDVAFDVTDQNIYVAERAKNGGMILGYEMPIASGDPTPTYTKAFSGASAVTFGSNAAQDFCAGIDGGLVEFETGGTETTIFIDGNPDMISFSSDVPVSTDYQFTYVVTDANGMILGIPPGNTVDFDPAGVGACLVYGLTYTGDLNIAMGDDLLQLGLQISSGCFDLSNNFLTVNRIEPCPGIDGGSLEFDFGGTTTTIFIDGNPDMLSFVSTVPNSADYEFTYVVTDADGNILGIPPGNTVDFEPAGLGACLVYGLTYTGNLNISMGVNLLENGLDISDDCFDLSDNFLTVNRINPPNNDTQIFVSSNNSGLVGVITENAMNMFDSQGMDADGIFYNKKKDILYQLNRSDDVINIYTGISDAIANGTNPVLVATSTSDFSNGREIAIFGNKLVVADDADADNNFTNRLVIYTLGANNSISFDKKHEVNFSLWGLHLEGTTLYAIQDVSPNLAVFKDFFNNQAGPITEDQVVYFEGLVRTHGLTYNASQDLMILTDIGAASSANDGFLVIVPDFSTKINDNSIFMSEQIRVGGGGSMLGNPVDVAYDELNSKIYVAERAQNGGMVLGFDMPSTSGDITPIFSKEFMGASAVNIPVLEVGACSNINGGLVAFQAGGTETTIFIDGVPDMISFTTSTSFGGNYDGLFTYVVTDANGTILGIPPGNTVDFDPAGIGACLVFGLSYTGNLNIVPGDNLLQDGLVISDDCYDLSDNFLTVNRVAPLEPNTQIFVSSNNFPAIGIFGTGTIDLFTSQGMDADGIYYNPDEDVLYQLNRSDNVINIYTGIADALANATNPTLVATSSSDFTNGREIAVSGNKLVVADDANAENNFTNRLVVYTLGNNNSITLDKIHEVNFNLWGIHLDGATLYAIQDNSPNVALFTDFFNNAAGLVNPDVVVFIENLVRTHGITYSTVEDLLILTDIGAASSADDGFLVIVENFMTKIGDNAIDMSEQLRVGGNGSMLGNPVDVAYDDFNSAIYVSERAKNGGMVLGFEMPTSSGNIYPFFAKEFTGASGINIPTGLTGNFSDTPDALVEDVNQDGLDSSSDKISSYIVMSKLFPIPTTHTLNAVLESKKTMSSTINIYNINGSLVKSQRIDIVKGNNQYQIDVSDLAEGVLFFEIPELQKTHRFIKSSF